MSAAFLLPFLVFVIRKITVNENVSFKDYVSGIRFPDVTFFPDGVIANFIEVVLYLLSSLVNGPISKSISSLALEL